MKEIYLQFIPTENLRPENLRHGCGCSLCKPAGLPWTVDRELTAPACAILPSLRLFEFTNDGRGYSMAVSSY